MTASITFYNTFRKWIADSTFNLSGGTYKVSLHTSSYAPSATTQSVYADLTNELGTANGYTSGGFSLVSPTWTQTGASVAFTSNNPSWTASGGSIVSRFLVLRGVGTLNGHVDPLICWVLMDTTPADITVSNGNTLTIQWNASGIFTLT